MAPDSSHPVELERLDDLLSDLDNTSGGMMREHLEAARYYLLGGMPREYKFTLKTAEENLPDIEDRDLRERVADYLRVNQSGDSY